VPSVSGGTDPQASANPASVNAAPECSFAVVRIFPHDPAAYTQGLAYGDGFRYAGRGLNGRSSLRKVRLEAGEAIQQINLGSEYFGEEITLGRRPCAPLTWKSGTGFECDLEDFRLLRRFCCSGKGWGLATDGTELFLGDGDVGDSCARRRKLQGKAPLQSSPWDDSEQSRERTGVFGRTDFRHVWHSNRVARISPQTGEVVEWIDRSGLPSSIHGLEPAAVLNGIANDPVRKRLFVAGKRWPSVLEIRVSPKRLK